MTRSLLCLSTLSLMVACGSQTTPESPPAAPDEGPGFAAWDGQAPRPSGDASTNPDVTPDAIAPTDAAGDLGPTPNDVMDTMTVDVTPDGGDTMAAEEVVEPPMPCASNEDCVDFAVSGPCMAPACNPASNECIEIFRAVGTPCDTGDLCKSGQVCQGGECTGGAGLDCADEDPCTTDMCDPAQGCIYQPVVDCCVPDCEDKVCGTDGCGGTCGFCNEGWSCTTGGTCINCVPNCIGLTCGEDGCGGVCGVCPDTWFCIDPGICMECLPDCVGKQCGPDGCGGSCGSCGANTVCDGALCTSCLPDCEGKQCGSDGCGGTCGLCGANASCTFEGVCECSPDCEGKTCGDNGCGGTCGDCEVGQVCGLANVCQTVASAKTCDNPIIIPGVPFSTLQDTTGAPQILDMPAAICGLAQASGVASPEHVYSFTPQDNDTYTFHVSPQSFDAVIYLVADCSNPQGTCLTSSDEAGDELLSVPLIGEKTYFLVVDGHGDLAANMGLYNLSVYAGLPVSCTANCDGKACGNDGCGGSCGACGPDEECTAEGTCDALSSGDTCELPIVIDSLPFSVAGDTTNHAPDYDISSGTCAAVPATTGEGSSDVVYAFTPEVDGNYLLTVPSVWDVVLYIVTDCASMSETCIAFADDVVGNSEESLVSYLLADQTYYIVVDGDSWNTNLGGEYVFKFDTHVPVDCTPVCAGAACGDDGCGGYCGLCVDGTFCEGNTCVDSLQGDSCETAFEIATLPFQATGDTTGAHADYSFSMDGCPGKDGGWGLKGSDQVYHLQAPSSGTYQIDVAVQYDALVYLVTDCADINASCIMASDSFGWETESITTQMLQGTDYFIIIDYWSNTSDGTGTYDITVDQTCVASCSGVQCGNDGCGGSCGACTGSEVCLGGGCVSTAVDGESCDNPLAFNLGLGTFYADGDTSWASADVSHEMLECTGDGKAGIGPDHVYAVTALEDAQYTITLTIPEADVDLGLWVATDCADTENTCFAESDAFSFAGSTEIVNFDATANQTYFVVVDSNFTQPPLSTGPYSLAFLAE